MIPGINIGDIFLKRYEVYEYLGDHTILALDQDAGDVEVVLRILPGNPRDAGLRIRFLGIVDSMRLLNEHPNVVTLKGQGWTESPECFYLVYDHIQGVSLENMLADGLRTPDRSSFCWSLVSRICEVLGRAHAENVAHWDLNPSSILFVEGDDSLKLAHLGVSDVAHTIAHGAVQPYDIYASHERRASNRDALDHSSDFYSLGLIAYHILTAQPPTGSFRPTEAIEALNIREEEKDILKRMLSSNSSERYRASFEIATDLQKAVQPGKSADVYSVVMSDTAILQVSNAGMDCDDLHNVTEWVLDQLGQSNGRPVTCSYNSRDRSSRIWLAGAEAVFVCSSQQNKAALTVEEVRFESNILEICHASGIAVDANFRIFVDQSPSEDPRSIELVASLHRALHTYEQRRESENARKKARELGLKGWRDVLDVEKAIVEERQIETVPYDSVSQEGGYVLFTISGEAVIPDDWSANRTRLAVRSCDEDASEDRQVRTVAAGELRTVTGNSIGVSLLPSREFSELPVQGLLMQDISGDMTNLRRQTEAVNAFSSRSNANPKLADMFLGSRGIAAASAPGRIGNIEFLDPNVRDNANQSDIVERALAAGDLFLIQGPPGTGKTTVIAEIIYQELRRNPAHRVLLTSQTNIAVDNVLEKLGETDLSNSILRMGRADDERIRADWLIDNRVRIWEEGLRERSSEALRDLHDRENVLRKVVEAEEDGTLKELFALAHRQISSLTHARGENSEYTEATEQSEAVCNELAQSIENDERWIAQQEGDRLARVFVQKILVSHWPPRKKREKADLRELALRREQLERNRVSHDEERRRIQEWRQLLRDSNELVSEREQELLLRVVPISEVLVADADIDLEYLVREPDAAVEYLESLMAARLLEIGQVSSKIDVVQDWLEAVGDWTEAERRNIQDRLIMTTSIIGATCIYSGSPILRDHTFDIVIVDEAGKATAPEVLVPIVKSRKVILVGDEKQLPPYIDSEIIAKNKLEEHGFEFGADTQYGEFDDFEKSLQTSLFQSLAVKAQEHNPDVIRTLTTQYRMHPAIGSLVSDSFYEGLLDNGVSPADRNHEIAALPKSVYWYSTAGLPRPVRRERGMFYNQSEVDFIAFFLRWLDEYYGTHGTQRQVGVISGYGAQVRALSRKLGAASGRTGWKALDIEIATVDAFQGRDKDIVLFSTVRSNPGNRLGFLKDYRRINVALSRAKELLVIVGDHSTPLNSRMTDSTFAPLKDIVEYVTESPACELDLMRAGRVLNDD